MIGETGGLTQRRAWMPRRDIGGDGCAVHEYPHGDNQILVDRLLRVVEAHRVFADQNEVVAGGISAMIVRPSARSESRRAHPPLPVASQGGRHAGGGEQQHDRDHRGDDITHGVLPSAAAAGLKCAGASQARAAGARVRGMRGAGAVALREFSRGVAPAAAADAPACGGVYAFARVADDMADEGTMIADERLARLGAWQRRLHAAVAVERSVESPHQH